MSDTPDDRAQTRDRSPDRPAVGGSPSATDRLKQDHTQTYIYLTAAFYAALVAGGAITALLHDALAPDMVSADSWAFVGFAPLIAGAAGFYTGNDLDGMDAYLSSFAGSAAGYLILFMGTYVIRDALLNYTQGEIEIAMQIGIAVGIGVTGALFAYVADNYEDFTA